MRNPLNPLVMNGAVQYLLVINLAVFALQFLLQIVDRNAYIWLLTTFGLVPSQTIETGKLWQVFSYMFLHGGLFHLLFNMLALWMFGGVLERVWGMRRFLKFYLFCGVGAGITVVAVAWLSGDVRSLYGITIGASGAILGLLTAFGMLFPEQIIYLYFFPVKAKYAVVIFGALSLFFAFSGTFSGISHVGHLGGILFALIYLRGRLWWNRLTRR